MTLAELIVLKIGVVAGMCVVWLVVMELCVWVRVGLANWAYHKKWKLKQKL